MDARTLGITIGIAAIAIAMGCLTAVALMEGPSGEDGPLHFDKDGKDISGAVGVEMDELVCNDLVTAINAGIVEGYDITSSNLPEGLGLDFYLHYNDSVNAKERFELRISGTPLTETGEGSGWDGHYVVEFTDGKNAYTVEGELNIAPAA